MPHQAGRRIWTVPGHFPDDPHGLPGSTGRHKTKGSSMAYTPVESLSHYGRVEVKNFLLNSALFCGSVSIDGLRVDAVASSYLDYRRKRRMIPISSAE